MPNKDKRCSACQQRLPLSAFHKNPCQFDGLNNNCKECCSKANKKWYIARKADPTFLPFRNKQLRDNKLKHTLDRFGLTIERYQELAAKGCGVCGRQPNGRGRLHFDHDHITDRFRGLLCTSCNTAIGSLKDDVAIVEKAMRYLLRHGRQQTAA